MRFEFFADEDLSCPCGCSTGLELMNEKFMKKMIKLRKKMGFPFIVYVGFRCKEYNQKVSKTGLEGPHTTGHAMKIILWGNNVFLVIAEARKVGLTGIGLMQKGPRAERYIHLDDLSSNATRPRPWVWTY